LEKAKKERVEANRQVNMYQDDSQKKEDLKLAKVKEDAARAAYDIAKESLEIQRPSVADDKDSVSDNGNASGS